MNQQPFTLGGAVQPLLSRGTKSDFAACVGDTFEVEFPWQRPGPQSLQQGANGAFAWPAMQKTFTGVIYDRSSTRPIRGRRAIRVHDRVGKGNASIQSGRRELEGRESWRLGSGVRSGAARGLRRAHGRELPEFHPQSRLAREIPLRGPCLRPRQADHSLREGAVGGESAAVAGVSACLRTRNTIVVSPMRANGLAAASRAVRAGGTM